MAATFRARHVPALRRLHRIGGAQHQQVGYRPQCRQMLDRLMRRSVFAEPDGIVRHHEDDALSHQRGQTDRGPAIVGEHQERAGKRDQPAMQRDAVHARRHPVLAHAVMDEAPVILAGRDHRIVLGLGEHRARQIGRAAERVGQLRAERLDRDLGRLAGRDRGLLRRRTLLSAPQERVRATPGISPDSAASNGLRMGLAASRASHAFRVRAAALARRPPLIEQIGRNLERRIGPAQRGPRACDLFGAQRFAMRLRGARAFGRAVSRWSCGRRSAPACRLSCACSVLDRPRPRPARRSATPPSHRIRSASPHRPTPQGSSDRRSRCGCRRTARSAG